MKKPNMKIYLFVLFLAFYSTGHAKAPVRHVMDCRLVSFEGFTEACQIANEIDINANKFNKRTIDLLEGSTEGETLETLFDQGIVKKITVSHYGEMGNRNLEVFLKNKTPFFFSEGTTYYDRPVYIEGFKEVSKTLLYYLFKGDSVFGSNPATNKPPKRVSKEIEQTIHEQIDLYIKLIAAEGSKPETI